MPPMKNMPIYAVFKMPLNSGFAVHGRAFVFEIHEWNSWIFMRLHHWSASFQGCSKENRDFGPNVDLCMGACWFFLVLLCLRTIKLILEQPAHRKYTYYRSKSKLVHTDSLDWQCKCIVYKQLNGFILKNHNFSMGVVHQHRIIWSPYMAWFKVKV